MQNRHILECPLHVSQRHFEVVSLIYNPIVLDIKLRESEFGLLSDYR